MGTTLTTSLTVVKGSVCFQMEVIVGDFGIVVVPRDGADTERIMNHSSILRKYKVRRQHSDM